MKKNSMRSQRARIFADLEKGDIITTMIAFRKYGCCRLSERIREIDVERIFILHEWAKINGKKVMTYRMSPAAMQTIRISKEKEKAVKTCPKCGRGAHIVGCKC